MWQGGIDGERITTHQCGQTHTRLVLAQQLGATCFLPYEWATTKENKKRYTPGMWVVLPTKEAHRLSRSMAPLTHVRFLHNVDASEHTFYPAPASEILTYRGWRSCSLLHWLMMTSICAQFFFFWLFTQENCLITHEDDETWSYETKGSWFTWACTAVS